ncbi:MAG: T9SS type A sorting domain-containing protein [Bacteroidia bacterium]
MNKFYLSAVTLICGNLLLAQTQLSNPGFENWGNTSPGVSGEPTGWYSNKSGSNVAQLANATCFQDNAVKHSGNYSARVETISYFGTSVNGALVTGVVNAPNTTKSNGYIGTVNYSNSSDDRRTAFTGRPDSIVGWYQYTSGGSGEQAKLRAILHTGDYYDPETPTTYHPDPSANKIADALFLGSTSNVTSWTRFAVAFNYVSSNTPSYIMINITPSANQSTTVTGSKMWIDDIAFIYNSTSVAGQQVKNQNIKVFCNDKTVYVDFLNRSEDQSTISIYDLTGKVVSTQRLENNRMNSVNISNLETGMYLYRISGTEFQKSGKFIVE